jgi:glycosyltransferase involved in cell wall biosynthesis
LEAWAHRLPVVATRTPGAQELIIEGQNGLLTALKDPQALAATILEIITGGPREWHRLAQNGWQKVVQHHSQDAIVNDYLNMYTELSSRSGRL